MSAQVHHPLFARIYDRISRIAESQGEEDFRREMLAGLSGTVIEVGAGNGLNFPIYPEQVERVMAVEPEGFLREKAIESADAASVEVEIVNGLADALPAEDDSFDAGVFSLVLCSVPDQASALAEMKRVLKPGGEVRFYEHVADDRAGVARIQRVIEPIWKRGAGGCHLTRNTGDAIADAGFEIAEMKRVSFLPNVLAKPVEQHIIGRAIKPRT